MGPWTNVHVTGGAQLASVIALVFTAFTAGKLRLSAGSNTDRQILSLVKLFLTQMSRVLNISFKNLFQNQN